MAMTRTHFQKVADILVDARKDGRLSGPGLDLLVSKFSTMFRGENASFSDSRFRSAIYDELTDEEEEGDDDDFIDDDDDEEDDFDDEEEDD